MKTFIIHVRERRDRATTTTKLISIAEDSVKAVALVKGYYGPACHGWNPNAEFVVIGEIPANSAKMV